MNLQLPSAVAVDLERMRKRIQDYAELGKLRVVTMVLVTTAVGFYLGSRNAVDYVLLLPTLIGTGLAAAGTMALNQLMERDLDAKMRRTCNRPLPDRRLQPAEAFIFGVGTTAIGLLYLAFAVNLLSCLVTAATTFTYLLMYTPLKRRTHLSTVVGAVPGALPPVTGWVASTNQLSQEAWILFGILFLWQLPHSLAIARLYRDDYARAGMRLLPVVEPDGKSAGRQVVANCFALLLVGLMPVFVGMAGATYFLVALILGGAFLAYGIAFGISRDAPSARQLLYASLVYLPVLLLVMALDKVPH